jgi:hypothetical protein
VCATRILKKASVQYSTLHVLLLTDGDQDGGGRIVSPPLQLLVREGTDVILPCHTLNQGRVSPSLQLLVREGTDVILPCHTLNQGRVSPSLQLLVREGLMSYCPAIL